MKIKRISNEDGRTIGLKIRLDQFTVIGSETNTLKQFHTLLAAINYAAKLIRSGQQVTIYPK